MVVVTVNPLYTSRELRHQLQDSGAHCALVAESLDPKVREVMRHTAVEKLLTDMGLCAAVARGEAHGFASPALTGRDLAFLQYTGGTTGVSKGAMLTHGSVMASLAQLRGWAESMLEPPGASVVTPLPLYTSIRWQLHCSRSPREPRTGYCPIHPTPRR